MDVPTFLLNHRKVRTLLASLASLVFCIALLFNVSTASAATLAADMVQASKDACISLAKTRGFAVETVIDAQPADGDEPIEQSRCRDQQGSHGQGSHRGGST